MNILSKLPPELQNLPEEIKQIKNLFFKGHEELLNKPKISIVGTRRPNAYTKIFVSNLASALASRGVVVVSGAAMGVDALAHRGAYPNTIAVMGNSLDIIYPKVNESLIKNMQENSLVLSEYRQDHQVQKYDFVMRNRIVVALGEKLIIAQADKNSGSMHSAQFAKMLGKQIYVLPHRIGESEGTNELLANGEARAIYDIDAFCNEFGMAKNEDDELIEFCKKEQSLEKALEKFGSLVYEYELEGKIQIEALNIRVLA